MYNFMLFTYDLGPVYTMYHEVGTMEDGLFPWSDFMIQTSMVLFLKESSYKACGPLTRCKPNVDQEEWPCTKKWIHFFSVC